MAFQLTTENGKGMGFSTSGLVDSTGRWQGGSSGSVCVCVTGTHLDGWVSRCKERKEGGNSVEKSICSL